MALSRVFVGVHYPHDVAVGYLLGVTAAPLLVLAFRPVAVALVDRFRPLLPGSASPTPDADTVVVGAVDVAARGLPSAAPAEPWFYAGGVLGIVTIGSAVLAVRRLGVLLVGLCQVAGQLVGALAVDLVAPAAGGQLSAVTVIGTALTLIAVAVAALPARR
ncbi:DMT family transporter [Saccharothrix sp. MB29]|nr:DMT family transporter [Saccharothrix sp. MB29]